MTPQSGLMKFVFFIVVIYNVNSLVKSYIIFIGKINIGIYKKNNLS